MRSGRLVVVVNTPKSRNANQPVQDPESTRPMTTKSGRRNRPETTIRKTKSSQHSSQEIVTEFANTYIFALKRYKSGR